MQKKVLLFISLILLPVLAFAQFEGGSYDGYAKGEGETEVFDQYTGGSSDGYAKGETAEGGSTLPVVLSVFTVQLIENTPILNWTTQSETNNAGWNIFRSENDSLEQSLQINPVLISRAGTCTQPTEYTFEDELPVQADSTYLYWLESVAISGISNTYGPISLTIPENEWHNPYSPEIPKPYGLHQNYPNPFNPLTEISFMMRENLIAELSIYNLKGQKIKTLFKNRAIPEDDLIISNWEGKDESGKEVSTGIYFYKLRTTKGIHIRKMILMK